MNNLAKLMALMNVMNKGEAVANPELWKKGQISATILGGFLIAAVQAAGAFGIDLPLGEDNLTAIAGGIVAVVNVWLTIATSKKLGTYGLDATKPD